MSAEIAWRVELTVKPGMLAAFALLTGEMVESARNERGVLSFQRFVSDDGTCVEVYERYVDSAAATVHLEKFAATFAVRFSTMVERKRFRVFGNPSAQLKALLDKYGADYLQPMAALPYWA